MMNDRMVGVEDADVLLLVGTNPRYEAPVLNARIRKTFLHSDIEIGVIGPNVDLTYDFTHIGSNAKALDELLAGKHEFSKVMAGAKKPMIILGSHALKGKSGPRIFSKILQMAERLHLHSAEKERKIVNILHHSASEVGALDLGYKAGVSAIVDAPQKMKLLYMLGADENAITRDKLDPHAFIIYQGHNGDAGAEMADIVIPGAAYTEKDGTYVNTEGRSQKGYPAVAPPGDARHDWKIIRAISEVAGKKLPYDTLPEIRVRLSEIAPHLTRYGDVEESLFLEQVSQLVEKGMVDEDIIPPQLELEHFWMTNSVTRASPTMAECVKAARNYKENPYLDVPKQHSALV
ncbi:hypothetical protein AB6A40_010416 [Gnathostoma spinigerum]|uniref:Uncharacterized protein n=1 Tax=Gnathostoma spinigerum TaxID=75299 RepID=A0ABD6F2P5_9BILA